MNDKSRDPESILSRAIETPSGEDRDAYIQRACGEDLDLRAQVEKLVADHFQAGSFLDRPAVGADATVDSSPDLAQVGSQIGPYKLRERLGEGGMGVVWAAEQTQPLRRKVALKVIKPGMDSSQVIARFEAERQALALMDHENIARILDAGSTPLGHPYFVMELIRGVPITEYCDANKLTVRQRLVLFRQVCLAIQHAHQKGVIHRDLKPSNVLVTLHDGIPVPKVIDFGIAKALNRPLTEKTVYTRVHQAIGTLAYMSPEAAELSGLDMDTRADVYGLGVLLYELLTGATPFEKRRLEEAALHEACRIIREEEPPRLSTRISTMGEAATIASAHRGTGTRDLAQLVRGDLDWIVAKSLEKDRTRRYESPGAFAADVKRFLENEPIEARPPSRRYQMKKMLARHRSLVTTVALVNAVLVLALVAVAFFAMRERHVSRKLMDALVRERFSAIVAGDSRKLEFILESLEQGEDSQLDGAVLRGICELNRGDYESAFRIAESTLHDMTPERDSARIGPLAVLAASAGWAGHNLEWETAVRDLRRSVPQSGTDCLLKAYGLAVLYPEEALAALDLDKAREVKHSTAGLIVRGQAGLILAMDQKNATKLDDAVTDLDRAQFLCPGSQAIIGWKALAVSAATELARSEKRRDDEDRYIQLAKETAAAAERLTSNPFIDYSLYHLYRAVGEKERAIEAARQTVVQRNAFDFVFAFACLLWYDGARASAEFDQVVPESEKNSNYYRASKALILAGTGGDAGTVRELTESLLDHPSTYLRYDALLALSRVSGADEVKRYANRALNVSRALGKESEGMNNVDSCIEFLAGKVTEKELLDDAKGHGFAIAAAHTTIAMLQFAEGNLEAARDHLRKAVDTQTVNSFNYEWARACLAQLDDGQDP